MCYDAVIAGGTALAEMLQSGPIAGAPSTKDKEQK
jgi:hypothetical protein